MSTIGFHMIVNAGEAALLDRCMKSVSQLNFDELVVVVTKPDEEVERVARKYASRVEFFEWCNDFAAARNAALQCLTTDYAAWCDADDVLTFEDVLLYRNGMEIVRRGEYDFYIGEYIIDEHEDGSTRTSLPRVLFFRNRNDLHWEYPVHETIAGSSTTRSKARLDGVRLRHRPAHNKDADASSRRNIKILQKHLKKHYQPRLHFYLAKEYMASGDLQKSIREYKAFIDRHEGTEDEMAYACKDVAFNLMYTDKDGKLEVLPSWREAETYARIGLSFSEAYAELFVLLGDISDHKKEPRQAIHYYERAMQCSYGRGGQLANKAFYRFVPADRLSVLNFRIGQYVNALKFNDIAFACQPSPALLTNRRLMLDELNDEYARLEKELCPQTA